jgi:hypothetical protein
MKTASSNVKDIDICTYTKPNLPLLIWLGSFHCQFVRSLTSTWVNLTQSHVVVILCLGPTLPQRAVSAICYISSSVVAASSQLWRHVFPLLQLTSGAPGQPLPDSLAQAHRSTATDVDFAAVSVESQRCEKAQARSTHAFFKGCFLGQCPTWILDRVSLSVTSG